MERKLILGGEKYLPYARSRLKALRAAGLQYARQPLLFPDASGFVKISGDIDYIYLTGSACLLSMDSGIVDVLAIGEAAPASFEPGILYESAAVQTYNAPFVLALGDTVRRNPSSGSAGQFSGSLAHSSHFIGGVPVDRQDAESFSPKTESDSALFEKKNMAILCPPSMFTGRCRLYVQALYGRHLYESGAAARLPMQLTNDANGAPALNLTAYKRDPVQSSLQINTSTGVHLDAAGRHWLFKVDGSNVHIYPLLGNACAQGMRRYLAGALLDGLPLNPTDREHLETYILSVCLPDVANKITIATTFGVSPYSMGYGWHWNWTGLTADIVVNDTVEQDPTNSAMRSTHYRLQLTPPATINDSWMAATSIVEGPSAWSVYRVYWTVAEPDWGTYTLAKTTPKHSLVTPCNAPFYAFYLRDELQICRVQVLSNAAAGTSRTMSLNYAQSATYHSNIECSTVGMLGGFLDDRAASSAYLSAAFTCGSLSSGELPVGKTADGYWSELVNKTLGGGSDAFGWSNFGTRSFNVGYPVAGTTGVWEISPPIYGQVKTFKYAVYYDIRNYDYHKEFASSATLVVPFYDAQAIYMQATSEADSTNTGAKQSWAADYYGFDYVIDQLVAINGDSNNTVTYRYYAYNDGGGGSGANSGGPDVPINEIALDVYVNMQKLLCSAGVLDAIFSHLGEFHNNELDTVAAGFYTTTGTSTQSAVALAPGYITPFGEGSGPGSAPVLVGWV